MKTKIKTFLNSNWAVFIFAFSIGVIFHYTINTKLMAEDKKESEVPIFSNNLTSDFDNKIEQHLKRIRKEHEMLFSDLNFSQIGTLNLKANVDVTVREDDKFKYIEIDPHGDINKDYLKVDIKNGLMRIYGEIKEVKQEDRDNRKMYSSFASSVSRTLSIPPGVDEKKAEILKEQNKIVVKFPKIQFTS